MYLKPHYMFITAVRGKCYANFTVYFLGVLRGVVGGKPGNIF